LKAISKESQIKIAHLCEEIKNKDFQLQKMNGIIQEKHQLDKQLQVLSIKNRIVCNKESLFNERICTLLYSKDIIIAQMQVIGKNSIILFEIMSMLTDKLK